MARTLSESDVPSTFVEVAKAIYGDGVDVRELWDLSKAMDSSTVHIDQPTDRKRKGVAAGLVVGSAAEGISAVRATQAAAAKLREPVVPQITGAAPARRIGLKGQIVRMKRIPESKAGKVGEAALQLGNLAVGLTAAHELVKKPKQQVGKAFRMKPLNPEDVRRTVSAKARRPGLRMLAAAPVAKAAPSQEPELTWSGEISKVDDEKHQVFGWFSLAEIDGHPVVDLQGDVVPIDEIEKSAYTYVLESRKGGDMHERVGKGLLTNFTEPRHTADLIESFVVTPEKIEKMGLPPGSLPLGWWGGFHVNDPQQWQDVKDGKRLGFSIHGAGRRTPIGKREHHPVRDVRRRASAAAHPPRPRLKPVESTAISAMGYQRQTRRMAIEMRSRPGEPYEYRMNPKDARRAEQAPSLGSHYAREIRSKTPRARRYTVADRARLFANPPDVSKAVVQPAIGTALGTVGTAVKAKAITGAPAQATAAPAGKPRLKPMAQKLMPPAASPVGPPGKTLGLPLNRGAP